MTFSLGELILYCYLSSTLTFLLFEGMEIFEDASNLNFKQWVALLWIIIFWPIVCGVVYPISALWQRYKALQRKERRRLWEALFKLNPERSLDSLISDSELPPAVAVLDLENYILDNTVKRVFRVKGTDEYANFADIPTDQNIEPKDIQVIYRWSGVKPHTVHTPNNFED